MKRRVKKILALLLSSAMLVGTVPVTALAAQEETAAEVVTQAASEEAAAEEAQPEVEAQADTSVSEGEISTFGLDSDESIKEVLKKAIYQYRDQDKILVKTELADSELQALTDQALSDSKSGDLIDVTYTKGTSDTSTMNVERNEALVMAMDDLDAINEAAPVEQQVSDEEMQVVYEHYAELQEFYAANTDYFGLADPYWTSKDTEASPIGAILTIAGIPMEAIGVEGGVTVAQVDEIVVGFNQALPMYVQYYGAGLLAAKDQALAQIDKKNMSRDEIFLVLNDWLSNNCNFDMAAIMEIHTPEGEEAQESTRDNLLSSTPMGAMVVKKCVCVGYTAAYSYLIQWAFPEIYKNEDGSWKTAEEVNGKAAVAAVADDPSTALVETQEAEAEVEPTYIVDFVQIKWDSDVTMLGEITHFNEPHFFNAVNMGSQDKWYYVDSCYNDIYVECMQRNRVETDGNMTHMYFLCSDKTLRDWFEDNFEYIDTAYESRSQESEYEDAWYGKSNGPVYYDDNYWYYVKDTSDYVGAGSIMKGKDELVARKRDADSLSQEDGVETILVDYESGEGTTTSGIATTGGDLVVAGNTADTNVNSERFAALVHSAAYYENALYLNVSNEILKYDLATGVISKVKEYNKVSAVRDTDIEFTGMSYSIVPEGTEGITNTVMNQPLAAICIKDDGNLYASVATSFCDVNSYTVQETNYNNSYFNYGDMQMGGDNDNEEFMWSANFVETLDMDHVAGDAHTYAAVVVDPTCEAAGYTENRCTVCGESDGSEPTDPTEKLAHHYIHVSDETYTKDDDGNRIVVETNVCTRCLNAKETLDEGEVAGHTYDKDHMVFNWADDYSTCTVEATCNVCPDTKLDCTQDYKAETKDCTVTKEVTTEGVTTYKASVTIDGKEYTDTKEGTAPVKELPFTDVSSDSWYYESVAYVYKNKYMTGLDDTTFGPTGILSRGQFATILYRIEGEPDVTYTDKFSDVKDKMFYTDPVMWASDEKVGVVTGFDDGTFGPAQEMSREQMALMMYRYAKYQKYDTSQSADLSGFPDADKVSGFAQEAMKWAVATKLISGNGEDGTLDPQGNVSRAVCATIIQRYMEKVAGK